MLSKHVLSQNVMRELLFADDLRVENAHGWNYSFLIKCLSKPVLSQDIQWELLLFFDDLRIENTVRTVAFL